MYKDVSEITDGFVDIHCHILPAVDDGARDMDMSIEMLRIADRNGITGAILTPHYKPMRHNTSPQETKEGVERLQERIKREGINITLYSGNELYYYSEAVKALENNRVCTLADSSYVLVEFNPMDEFDYIRNGMYELLAGGYRPILAHAERYRSIFSKPEKVEDLVKMGCYIQVNAESVVGRAGRQAKGFAKKLLSYGQVHFIATDAHDVGKRSPLFKDCAKYISKKHGNDYMRELLCENPAKIIENKYI